MTKCLLCMVWEYEYLGAMAQEAYASTAIESNLTTAELRDKVLSEIHERGKHDKS